MNKEIANKNYSKSYKLNTKEEDTYVREPVEKSVELSQKKEEVKILKKKDLKKEKEEEPIEEVIKNPGEKQILKIGNRIFEIPNEFRTFDPVEDTEDIPNFSAILVGKRRSGKSILLRDIVYKNKNKFDTAYVFSETANYQDGLFDYIPENNRIEGFNIEILEKIFNKQSEHVLEMIENKKPNKIKKLLLIFDDIIGDKRTKTNDTFEKLYLLGRHLRISVITLVQYTTSLSPVIRTNVDFLGCFYLDNLLHREAIAERYLSTQHKRVGLLIFDNITQVEYQSIIIMNKKSYRRYEDFVYTYKVNMEESKGKFMIGNKTDDILNDTYERIKKESKKGNIFGINIEKPPESEGVNNLYL